MEHLIVSNSDSFKQTFSQSLVKIKAETKEFDRKIKISELDYLSHSNFAQAHFAENYVGIPL